MSAGRVLLDAFLVHPSDATFIELASSSDKKHWRTVLVYEKRGQEQLVDGPLVPVNLAARESHQFVRVSLWRNGSGPQGFGRTYFHLSPLGMRTSSVPRSRPAPALR